MFATVLRCSRRRFSSPADSLLATIAAQTRRRGPQTAAQAPAAAPQTLHPRPHARSRNGSGGDAADLLGGLLNAPAPPPRPRAGQSQSRAPHFTLETVPQQQPQPQPSAAVQKPAPSEPVKQILSKPESKIPPAPLIGDDAEFGHQDDRDAVSTRNKRKHHPKNEAKDNHVSSAKKSKKPMPTEKDELFEERRERKKPVELPRDILLPDGISVVNMGSLLGVSFEKLAAKMKELGFDYPTPDFVLNTDISTLIALEFGMNPVIRTASVVETNFKPRPPPEDWSVYPFRPPVVTIMGHVDHGKTTLLDTLRKTSVASGEAGGITQHIGAFNVVLPSGKKITFLDTPGHAAFSAMRERGARVTDIVVLVVAADDGVMPQTIEALKYAQEAGVQIVVAVNKCDKPGATPSKVKENLIRYGLLVEDYGGEVPAVEVSGLTGFGLDNLEETIVALSEMADIRGDSTGPVEASVIESRVAKGKGNVTTLLVTRGTLKPGQILVAGTSWCKVRTLCDDKGKPVKEALPSSPVEISGWKELPNAGDFVLEAQNENHAKEVIASRIENEKRIESMKSIEKMNELRIKTRELEETTKNGNESDDTEDIPTETTTAIQLPIVLKCDVHGSSEALAGAISGFPKHEVFVNIISSAVGQVTDSDVELAYAAGGRILAFNVPVDKKVTALANSRKVPIDSYQIIYKLMDDLQERMLDILPKEEVTVVLGEADVLQVFELNTKSKEQERIAGCRIMSGKVLKNERVRVIRGGEVVFDGRLKAFKHHKKDIPEASKGLECGMAFDGFNDLIVGDRVACYRIDKKRRTKLNYQ